jgi:hypothetical protein
MGRKSASATFSIRARSSGVSRMVRSLVVVWVIFFLFAIHDAVPAL